VITGAICVQPVWPVLPALSGSPYYRSIAVMMPAVYSESSRSAPPYVMSTDAEDRCERLWKRSAFADIRPAFMFVFASRPLPSEAPRF